VIKEKEGKAKVDVKEGEKNSTFANNYYDNQLIYTFRYKTIFKMESIYNNQQICLNAISK
jgi:hypothetical protein